MKSNVTKTQPKRKVEIVKTLHMISRFEKVLNKTFCLTCVDISYERCMKVSKKLHKTYTQIRKPKLINQWPNEKNIKGKVNQNAKNRVKLCHEKLKLNRELNLKTKYK